MNSSIVSYSLSKIKGDNLKTFFCGFENNEHNELEDAENLASFINCKNHNLLLKK